MAKERLTGVSQEVWDNEINKFNKKIYHEFLEQAHLSNDTITQYTNALYIFFSWVYEECDNKPLHKLKPVNGLRYQNYLINHGLSSSGVRFKRSAVSSLCNYITLYYGEDYPEFRPIYNKGIPSPANTKKTKEPLTVEEYNKVVEELTRMNRLQELAWFVFSYETGCRRSESIQLLKEVVDYDKAKKKDGTEKNYYVTHEIRTKGAGKVGKPRKFKFGEASMQVIKQWLDARGDDECPYVFISKRNGEIKQISRTTLNNWADKIVEPIVGKKFHPHLLRTMRATHMKDAGADIKAIQEHLGHNQSSTTEIYIVQDDDANDVDDYF